MNHKYILILLLFIISSLVPAYADEVIQNREDAQLFLKQLVEKRRLDFLYESPNGWGRHPVLSDVMGAMLFARVPVLEVKASDNGCVSKFTMQNLSLSDGEYDYYPLPPSDPTITLSWEHFGDPIGSSLSVTISSESYKNSMFTGNFRFFASSEAENIKLAQAIKFLRNNCFRHSVPRLF